MIFYMDRDNQKLVANIRNSQQVTGVNWVLRDIFPAKLYYLVPAVSSLSSTYDVSALDAGQALKFGVKVSADPGAATFLVEAMSWVQVGTGTSLHYEAEISLNTVDLIAAIGSDPSITLTGEFTVRHTDNSDRFSTQFSVVINQDYIRGTESPPAASTPTMWSWYTDADGISRARGVNANGETVADLAPI